MSLRINTIVQALIAMRNLNDTEAMMQGSVGRLSTGLRINTAGDDPAGLIISEGLRTQIKGIEQANRNVQDAVNMSKTAESSLSEVSRLLLDLRALAVHSSNTATIDAAQLQANQQQVRNVIQSIDRIAQQTSWGTKKLLNGAAGVNAAVTRTDLVSSLYIGPEFNGFPAQSGQVDIQRTTAATQTTTGAFATVFSSSTAAVNTGTFVINGHTFTVQPGQNISDVVQAINLASPETGVSANLVANGGGLSVDLTSTKNGSQFPIQFLETSNILNNGSGSNPAVGTDAVFTVTAQTSNGSQTETFTGGSGPGTDGLTLISPSGNRLVVTPSGNSTSTSQTIGQLTVGSMRFQIGANADQSAMFSIPSVFASTLGSGVVTGLNLSGIDLTSQQGATDAMKVIDAAVSQVAQLRGNLGSFQKNFLESTARSLDVASENLTASESQIRDADIAKEMSDYTKAQILRQSGIAVLAQANQSPQSILSLIKGG